MDPKKIAYFLFFLTFAAELKDFNWIGVSPVGKGLSLWRLFFVWKNLHSI